LILKLNNKCRADDYVRLEEKTGLKILESASANDLVSELHSTQPDVSPIAKNRIGKIVIPS